MLFTGQDGVPGRDVLGSSIEREMKWGSEKKSQQIQRQYLGPGLTGLEMFSTSEGFCRHESLC